MVSLNRILQNNFRLLKKKYFTFGPYCQRGGLAHKEKSVGQPRITYQHVSVFVKQYQENKWS